MMKVKTKHEANGPVSNYIKHHYRHFNSAVVIDAADAYVNHLNSGGKMFMTMGGAMSTAELGLSLAEMIRQDKVHAICCTGANLEEDVYNLVAHNHYKRIPNYRHLTPDQEVELLNQHLNRVTDTCIPEEEAMRRIERLVVEDWYAAEKNLPMFVPGWEDSTLGNMFAAQVIGGKVKNVHTVRVGIEYMMELARWYTETAGKTPLGFFQIAGGIAGDFPICVVPML